MHGDYQDGSGFAYRMRMVVVVHVEGPRMVVVTCQSPTEW